MPRKLLVIFLLAVLLSLAIMPSVAQDGDDVVRTGFRPDAPTYAIRGPYAVGAMDIVIEDADRPLTGMVWYPALNPDGAEESIVYQYGLGDMMPEAFDLADGRAIRDAAPDLENGPYPLVVWSHGSGSTLTITSYLFETWASYGFVVMGVIHTNNSIPAFMAAAADPDAQVIFDDNAFLHVAYRPTDMLRQIDYADMLTSSEGNLAGVIDMERIATAGYSYGGWTAQVAGGAEIDFGAFTEWCAGDEFASKSTDPMCDRLENETMLIDMVGADVAPGNVWPALTDSRIDAVVSIDPGMIPLLGENSLQAVEVPTLLLATTDGGTVSLEHNAQFAYDNIGSEYKSLAIYENSHHIMFLRCNDMWTSSFFGFCSDSVWDLDRVHDLADHITTAFLLSVLYGDEEAKAALMPDAMNFDGITYQTTLEQ
jgi:predicted dienelactone hydrolase